MPNADTLMIVRPALPEVLEASCACLERIWPDGHPALSALGVLRERLHESRLQVAVLGQFKRGKSTFINALLGAPLLPSAVVPLTAIPTFIAWGPTPMVRVTYQDHRPVEEIYPADKAAISDQLNELVTEKGNPENRRHIERVDLFVPADILRDGVVLIDTPGIGSTLRHNTDAAMQVLPECDAAMFVVSADPPITEAETAYLSQIQPHVVRLSFVLNKIDYLNPAELQEAAAFLQSALCRCGLVDLQSRILPLSARRALEARVHHDTAALASSGLTAIERDILTPLAREKIAALDASIRVKTATNLRQARTDLHLQIRALELPLEDLTQRSLTLKDALRETEAERQVVQDLLQGDRRRAITQLEDQAERLRQEARRHFNNVVETAVKSKGGSVDMTVIQQTLDAEIPLFFEARLGKVATEFRRSIEAMLARYQTRADALVASARQTVANLFDIPLAPTEAAEPFRLGPEPYWVSQKWNNALMPAAAGMLMRTLPAKMQQRHLLRQIAEQVSALVQRNVENLRWSTLQGVNETFRRYSAQLDARLAELLEVTDGAIARVIDRRQSSGEEAAIDLRRLQGLAATLEGHLGELEAGPLA